MKIRFSTAAAAALLAFSLTACTEAEQDRTAVQADAAGGNAEAATSDAGQELKEGAAAAGEVIESGAMKAAQAVEAGAGNVADRLEAEQAEAAAAGRPGAVDPVTDERQ